MAAREPGNIIELVAAIITLLILLDIFFLGWILVDEPILELIEKALAN